MSFADALLPFSNLVHFWWLPILAVLLDRMIGDPPTVPHPVRWIGALLGFIEPRARRFSASERLAGFLAAMAALFLTWLAVHVLLLFPFFMATVFAVYLGFAGLALGQLLREGKAALALLAANDIPGARAAVGMLVSRDVSNADHGELCRVLAETLSENCNDAFIAPFFWLVLGGPAGLWLYKTASTMDSMWGYPYEPWTRFGTVAARLDDVLAYVPARLTALFLYFGMVFRNWRNWRNWRNRKTAGTGAPAWPGFARLARDAKTMKSPNAGWPMAACAWIHGAAMGGKAVYDGKIVDKPVLGPPGASWTTDKLRDLLEAITVSAYGGAALLWLTGCLFWGIVA